MVVKVLTRMGVSVRAWAMAYKVLVCMVILYRIESWVVTNKIPNVMKKFHHLVAQRIAGMLAWVFKKGGVGFFIGDRGLGGGGSVTNEGVHLEATVYHWVIYCESPLL